LFIIKLVTGYNSLPPQFFDTDNNGLISLGDITTALSIKALPSVATGNRRQVDPAQLEDAAEMDIGERIYWTYQPY